MSSTEGPLQKCPDSFPLAGYEKGIDLKRQLLLRVTFFALVIGFLAIAIVFSQARERIRARIADTGGTVERLITGEAVGARQGSCRLGHAANG